MGSKLSIFKKTANEVDPKPSSGENSDDTGGAIQDAVEPLLNLIGVENEDKVKIESTIAELAEKVSAIKMIDDDDSREVSVEEKKCRCDPCLCQPCNCPQSEIQLKPESEQNEAENQPQSVVIEEAKQESTEQHKCQCNPCECDPCNCEPKVDTQTQEQQSTELVVEPVVEPEIQVTNEEQQSEAVKQSDNNEDKPQELTEHREEPQDNQEVQHQEFSQEVSQQNH